MLQYTGRFPGFAMIYTQLLIPSKLNFWNSGFSPHLKIKAPTYHDRSVNVDSFLFLSVKLGFFLGEEGIGKPFQMSVGN